MVFPYTSLHESNDSWDSLKLLSWNGYNESLMNYLYKIYQICMEEFDRSNPKILMHHTLDKTTKLLSTIYYLNINSAHKFDNSMEIKLVIRGLGPSEPPQQVTAENINDPNIRENRYSSVSRVLEELLLRTTTGEARSCL